MGYSGKWRERERARQLRAESWTLLDIARELGVSKASVSVWVRDVEFVPKPRNRGHPSHQPHPLTIRKQAEIERCRAEAAATIGELSDRDLMMFSLGLYAGEGAKTRGTIGFANTNPIYIAVMVAWLRMQFASRSHASERRSTGTMVSISTRRRPSGAGCSKSR